MIVKIMFSVEMFIVVIAFFTSNLPTGIPLKLKETNTYLININTRKKLEQWLIYKHNRGVELGSTEKQLQPQELNSRPPNFRS